MIFNVQKNDHINSAISFVYLIASVMQAIMRRKVKVPIHIIHKLFELS